MTVRAFLLLLLVDVAVVAGALALLGPRPPRVVTPGDPAGESEARRLDAETRALRTEAVRLSELLDERLSADALATATRADEDTPTRASTRPGPAPPEPPAGHASAEPDDLDRLEAALVALDKRRAEALGRETLRAAIGHVYPGLTPDQQVGVSDAIGGYRVALTRALGVRGADVGESYRVAVQELRASLSRVVGPAQVDEIVLRYAIKPGPPGHAPAVSPPVRRR